MKPPSLSKRAVGVLAACALGVLGVLTFSSPASAHDTSISAGYECDDTTGNWNVNWTVSNDYNTAATLSNVVATPTSITWGPGFPTVPKKTGGVDGKVSGSQVVPGAATSAKLSLKATWPDQFTDTASKTVNFEGKCEKKKVCTEVDEAKYNHTFNAAGGTGTVKLKGDLPLCGEQPFVLVSYLITGTGSNQRADKYDIDNGTINGNQGTLTLHVNVPNCKAAVVFMFGSTAPDVITEADPFSESHRILGVPGSPGNRSSGVPAQASDGVNDDKTCAAAPSVDFAITCDGTTVTLKNGAGAHLNATFKVNGTEHVLEPGKTKVVNIPATTSAVNVKSGGQDWNSTWELPEGCVILTPSASCEQLQVKVENNSGVAIKAIATQGGKIDETTVAAHATSTATASAADGKLEVSAAGLTKSAEVAESCAKLTPAATCDNLSVVVENGYGSDIVVTYKQGSTTKEVTVKAKSNTTIKVATKDGTLEVLAPFIKVSVAKPANCVAPVIVVPPAPAMPQTGAAVSRYAAAAVTLIAAGLAMLVLARRRRITE